MNQEQALKVARALVEAMLEEFMLWAQSSPLDWKAYEKLRRSIAVDRIARADISPELMALATSQPFWGFNPQSENLRGYYQEILADTELQGLLKRAIETAMQDKS